MKTSIHSKLPTFPPIALAAFLFTSITTASAQTPAIVIEKSRQLQQTVRIYAQTLSTRDLMQLEKQLDLAIQTAIGRGMGGGRPPIEPCPPGRRCGPGGTGGGINNSYPASVCKLLGPGSANGWTYNFRIALNDQVMEGTNNLDQALQILNRYAQDGMCIVSPEETCKLAGPGSYSGWTYNFRVMAGELALSGTNNSNEALATMKQLENAGVCRMNGRPEACQLLGRGSYAGWSYNFRVAVGAEVLNGTNDYNAAKTFIDTLKNSRLCY